MSDACPACAVAPMAREVAASAAPLVQLSVPSLHCAGCIGKVERALHALPGVEDARVNLTLKRVSVATHRDAADLVACLAEAGFEAHALNAAFLARTDDPKGRDLLLRLGVAGFAMMNIMLLSVAVWSGAEAATRDLFHLISAAIALPVVAYSGQPFFRSAARALAARTMNMDVPISLAILMAAVMSLFETLNSGHHAYFDAAVALTFFLLIGRYLDHRTRRAAHSAAKDLAALEEHTAQRMEQGRAVTVEVADLALGDEILIPTGTRVPVDGTLLGAQAVTDRAFLTGESVPVTSAQGAAIRAGEINLAAPFRLRATAVGEDTTLRQIATLVEQAENARTRYTTMADRAAKVYAPSVHLLALAAFLGWWLFSGDLRMATNVAIAVLIITCPCALGIAVPAVSTAAIGKLYAMGILVKSGTALERLAEVDHAVFDKTGTLTRPGLDICAQALDPAERQVALALAQASSHPLSRAVVQALPGTTPAHVTDITEHPGQGLEGTWEGRPVRLGQGPWLGAGTTGLALQIGDHTVALGQTERLRPGAAEAVAGLRDKGLTLSLMSGDTEDATARLGETLGIQDRRAQISPKGKHDHLKDLADQGHRTVMVGDGLNDTAALATAHASIAPASALDAARNAADVVLLREGLEGLPTLLATARAASRLSQQNFRIATLYNVIAVPIALAGFATPLIAALAMSASSLTVLVNALRVRSAR